jgi:TonB-dependent starch-binding outer membrane protein SusC
MIKLNLKHACMRSNYTSRWLSLLLICGVMLFSAFDAFAATPAMQVSGTVSDEKGGGLPGVSVLVKGTNSGTITDDNGKYSISVPDGNAVLVFSSVGFSTQEIAVGSKSTVDVILTEGESLQEVVVVGYGTQRKVDLTGAVSSISAKDMNGKPATSMDQLMSGRSSGVQISNRSGDPGAPIEVRIRGVGTVGVNQPLWVIDGVPVVLTSNATVNTASYSESNPLAGINPADIESMDILKDASATAIYGARAANGVVIVTTKRGKEGKTVATYDGYYGVGTVAANKRFKVLDVAQYIALQKELGNDLNVFSGKPAFDWQDAIYQTATIKNHNLSVSGGTSTFNFNMGAGYHGQGGVERGQNFNRFSFKANSDIKVGKYLKFGESLIGASTDRNVQSEGANFGAYNSSKNAPYYQGYDATDPTGYNATSNAIRGAGVTASNYLWATDAKYNAVQVLNRKVLGSLYGEFEPISGLKYRLQGGADYIVTDGFFFQEESAKNYGGDTRASLLTQERPIELTTNLTNTLTYQKAIGKSNFLVMAGYEETSFRYDKVRLQGRTLFNSAIRFASVASSVAAANEADIWALRGALGRIFYAYDNKYLITMNVRRDQSSRFSPENRTGIFPSVSVGWRISDEHFLKSLKDSRVVDALKLRFSWGQSGNQFTGTNFAYLPSLAINSFYALGNAVVRGPAPIVFANKDLKWETSVQSDFGIDATLLGGKLDLTFDYYNKTTNDVLLSLPIPMTSGYFLPADANLGQIKNSGLELSLTYNNKVGDFRYSLGGNITTVKNNVVSLGGIPEIVTGVFGAQSHRTTVGEPLGYFYGYKTNGIYKTADEAAKALPDASSGGAAAGDIRFVDVNGDGKVDSKDRTKLGSPIPGYFYGINGSASWKNIDFSVLLQGVGDVQVFNAARQSLESMNDGNNQLTSVLNRWTASNTGGTLPRATAADPNANNRYSDRWIEDGSYMRIKNMQIGYTLPNSISKATADILAGARIYIGIQNLATFTKYKGGDPEVTRGASFQKGEFPLANGQDSGGSPQPRIIQVGAQLRF